MPIVLALLAAAVGAYFGIMRARNAAQITHELLDVASDVRAAARRFGFRRRADVHPADQIEDAKVAIAAIGVAFLELDDYPTAEQRDALVRGLREGCNVSHKDAEEVVILARWLVSQCNGPQMAVPRLSRALYRLSGQSDFNTLVGLVQTIAKFGKGELSPLQRTALEDVQRGLRLS